MENLKLYYKPTCPYCQRVLAFMKENNIEIPLLNVDAVTDFVKNLKSLAEKLKYLRLILTEKSCMNLSISSII